MEQPPAASTQGRSFSKRGSFYLCASLARAHFAYTERRKGLTLAAGHGTFLEAFTRAAPRRSSQPFVTAQLPAKARRLAAKRETRSETLYEKNESCADASQCQLARIP